MNASVRHLALSVSDLQAAEQYYQAIFEMEEGPGSLTFRDPYQITWQISVPGSKFRSAGNFADRWLIA
jgi:catechol 2,3-dioxygenase-like lactoylglutathione lyase family enzyme